MLQSIFDQNDFGRYTSFLRLLDRRKSSIEDLMKAAQDDSLSKQLRNANALFLEAKRVAATKSAQRFDALVLLTRDAANRENAMNLLAKEIKPSAPVETQRAVISAIAETGESNVPDLLVRDWANHGPESRSATLEALLRREPWAFTLLKHIENGAVSPSDLDAARRNRLIKHDSKRVRELAAKIFSQTGNSNRAKVIDEYQPALQLTGNAGHGKEIFGKLCITCHRRDGVGNEVGPNLQSVIDHPPEKLLVNILDPNADIQPGFNAYNCALANGEELYGLISAETATSVVFKFADGTARTINRSEINSLRSSNLSLMPEGLEQGLSKQDLADLIAYVKSR
jgi:putative heme-binding domain-containing protein